MMQGNSNLQNDNANKELGEQIILNYKEPM